MKPHFAKLLELAIGRWRPDVSTAVAKFGLGVLCPSPILLYGLSCVFSRQASIPTRGGLAPVIGLPAVAVGVVYVCVALMLYVHVCWEDHPLLAGCHDAARKLLALVIAIALAVTVALALL